MFKAPKIKAPRITPAAMGPLDPNSPLPASEISTSVGGTVPEIARGQQQLLGSLRRRPDQKRDRRTLLGG